MKVFSRHSAGLVAAAACWLAPTVANAEIVVNGGFETGSFAPWTVPPTIFPPQPNPQYFQVGGIVGVGGGHTGDRYAVMSSTQLRFISQLLPTEAGQDYELSFWLRIPGGGIAPFTVRWEGEIVMGTTLVLLTPEWQQFTIPVHSTFAGSLLEFGQHIFPGEFHMDDVSVVAVPAPGAAAVLALGGVVALERRRRR